jgi:palmitoyltransferase
VCVSYATEFPTENKYSGGFFGLFTAGMTGTSLSLVFRNLTQVENIAFGDKTHTLAILKPPSKELMRISPYMATHLSYSEIKYPLENGQIHPQFPAPSPMSYAVDGTEIAIPPQYQTQISNSISVPPRNLGIEVSSEMRGRDAEGKPVQLPDDVLERLNSAGAQVLSSGFPIAKPAQSLEIPLDETEESRQPHSSRDQLANRTFAILRMEQGNNPWDLGSRLLNFQSVMGTNIFDYLLPIKRSPCCNHENQESHFQIGPYVDLLKASVFFMEAKDMRFNTRKAAGRRNIEDLESQLGGRSRHRRRRNRRSRRVDISPSSLSPPEERPVPLRNGSESPLPTVQ